MLRNTFPSPTRSKCCVRYPFNSSSHASTTNSETNILGSGVSPRGVFGGFIHRARTRFSVNSNRPPSLALTVSHPSRSNTSHTPSTP